MAETHRKLRAIGMESRTIFDYSQSLQKKKILTAERAVEDSSKRQISERNSENILSRPIRLNGEKWEEKKKRKVKTGGILKEEASNPTKVSPLGDCYHLLHPKPLDVKGNPAAKNRFLLPSPPYQRPPSTDQSRLHNALLNAGGRFSSKEGAKGGGVGGENDRYTYICNQALTFLSPREGTVIGRHEKGRLSSYPATLRC
ncbi:hypothetical protein BHM03_00030130 [Ensete ventricosum]|nr:hypothetical protein BHM03_00030130 [Ensete ventricosum]